MLYDARGKNKLIVEQLIEIRNEAGMFMDRAKRFPDIQPTESCIEMLDQIMDGLNGIILELDRISQIGII